MVTTTESSLIESTQVLEGIGAKLTVEAVRRQAGCRARQFRVTVMFAIPWHPESPQPDTYSAVRTFIDRGEIQRWILSLEGAVHVSLGIRLDTDVDRAVLRLLVKLRDEVDRIDPLER